MEFNEHDHQKDLERLAHTKVAMMFYAFCATYWLMDVLKFIWNL
jgi:hypothetical protein